MSENNIIKRTSTSRFMKNKRDGEKIAVLTAYDFYTAAILEKAGVDAILTGDSLGMVLYGHDTTLPVTMEMMIAHTRAVVAGTKTSLVIADMPFMSYQPSIETAVTNAGRFLAEAGAGAVKLEGGLEMIPTVRRLVECGVPVMGHLGMTPQSINRFGGPKVQGRKDKSKQYLLESAHALEEAGVFGIVLELVESSTAAEITSALAVPTIGIGAGKDCDGQVLVINDILGLCGEFKPRFVRRYVDLPPLIEKAAREFIADVKSGAYPSDEESF